MNSFRAIHLLLVAVDFEDRVVKVSSLFPTLILGRMASRAFRFRRPNVTNHHQRRRFQRDERRLLRLEAPLRGKGAKSAAAVAHLRRLQRRRSAAYSHA